MINRFHKNTRSAWMLITLTVMVSASVVALLQLQSNPTRILFSQFDGNDYEIFVMDLDGNIQQLTDNHVDDWAAGWSPDKQQIAFRSQRDGMSRIYIMQADGSQVQAVSADTIDAGEFGHTGIPSWSSDGTQLAFEGQQVFSSQLLNYNIFVLDIATGEYREYGNDLTSDYHPDFSPDGRNIAFARHNQGEVCASDCEIFITNLDTGATRQLTHSVGMNVYPQWSPDGSQILFHSERDGNSDIYITNAYDGCHAHKPYNVTNHPALDRVGRWSDDGSQIIFRSERSGDSEIYVFDFDTHETQALTDNVTHDLYPDF